MSDENESSLKLLEEMTARKTRRGFLKQAGMGIAGVAGMSLLGGGAKALLPLGGFGGNGFGHRFPPPPPSSGPGLDIAILNFALNLEYLEAEFYTYATTGMGIEQFEIGVNGSGTPGPVTIKASPKVSFASSEVRQYAEEIAADERAHVQDIRSALLAANVTPAARPAIDLLNSFNGAAVAAGIGSSFNPFQDDLSFLLGAFIFEDVGVTAYKGAARLISNPDYLDAAAGILAVEAYHAGEIRVQVFQAGAAAQGIAQKISDLRDAASGAGDDDQGVTNANGSANIVPTDAGGIAFGRTTRQVLNIVYLDTTGTRHAGGFYPNGLNGVIR
jgi:hypothetical protein